MVVLGQPEVGRIRVVVCIEIHEADRAMPFSNRPDAGVGDPVISTQGDRDRASVKHFAHEASDRSRAPVPVLLDDRRVAVVNDPHQLERVHTNLGMRGPDMTGAADRARPVAGARVVELVVVRRAHDCHVDATQLRRILGAAGTPSTKER
jgi:hypothetical protein